MIQALTHGPQHHSDFVPFGNGQFPSDGHNAFSADFRFVACDTKLAPPRYGHARLLYEIERKVMHNLGEFEDPPHIQGDWRCDLHPRWSPEGRLITFDSMHEGRRQIYLADVSALVEQSVPFVSPNSLTAFAPPIGH